MREVEEVRVLKGERRGDIHKHTCTHDIIIDLDCRDGESVLFGVCVYIFV